MIADTRHNFSSWLHRLRKRPLHHKVFGLAMMWLLTLTANKGSANEQTPGGQATLAQEEPDSSPATFPFFPDETLCECSEEIARQVGLSEPIVVRLERECPSADREEEEFDEAEPAAALCAEVFELLELYETRAPSGAHEFTERAQSTSEARGWWRGLRLRLDLRVLFALQSRGQLGESTAYHHAGDTFFFATLNVELLR